MYRLFGVFGGQALTKGAPLFYQVSDLRSLGSWFIQGTDESTLVMDSLVPLMNYDLSDLGSLILIHVIPKECTPNLLLSYFFVKKIPLSRRDAYVWSMG